MIGIIIQARTGSRRFPRKIYEDINGKSTLFRVLEGCTSAELPHKIVLAMPEYDKLEFLRKSANGEFNGAIDHRFAAYFGHSDDLVDRYFHAARDNGISTIVRITADCPFTQGRIIDEMLCNYLRDNHQFMGNNELVSPTPYPDGLDVEIFKLWMLAETKQLTDDLMDREHVTPFMYRRGTHFSLSSFRNNKPNTMVSMKFPNMSFDNNDDLLLIKKVAVYYDKYGNLNKAILKTNE